jgi:hypothetical protein
MKVDPAVNLDLRHLVFVADASGDLASDRFDVGRHRLSIHLSQRYHKPIFVPFATALARQRFTAKVIAHTAKGKRTRWSACAEIAAFRDRLERRWGKALAKLRTLLTIAREWTGGAFERWQHAKAAGQKSHLTDVMLRLLVRACQVTDEILVLLENGFADAAMARWRTLHEIAIVSAVLAKYGEEIAERYVYYQIVESWFPERPYPVEGHSRRQGCSAASPPGRKPLSSDRRCKGW